MQINLPLFSISNKISIVKSVGYIVEYNWFQIDHFINNKISISHKRYLLCIGAIFFFSWIPKRNVVMRTSNLKRFFKFSNCKIVF